MGNLRVIRCRMVEDDINGIDAMTSPPPPPPPPPTTTTAMASNQDGDKTNNHPTIPTNKLHMDIMQGLHRAQRMRTPATRGRAVEWPFPNVHYHPVPTSIVDLDPTSSSSSSSSSFSSSSSSSSSSMDAVMGNDDFIQSRCLHRSHPSHITLLPPPPPPHVILIESTYHSITYYTHHEKLMPPIS